MSELKVELKQRVAAARGLDSQAHAEQLKARIEERLREAEAESDNALAYAWLPGSGPGTHWMAANLPGTYCLDWKATQPPRSLWVRLDDSAGRVDWAWVQEGTPRNGWNEIHCLDFDVDLLDQLILGLAEQEVWARGELPPA